MKSKPKLYTAPTDRLNGVALATWRELYGLAARVHAMAPWKWMVETDAFGVKVPARTSE